MGLWLAAHIAMADAEEPPSTLTIREVQEPSPTALGGMPGAAEVPAAVTDKEDEEAAGGTPATAPAEKNKEEAEGAGPAAGVEEEAGEAATAAEEEELTEVGSEVPAATMAAEEEEVIEVANEAVAVFAAEEEAPTNVISEAPASAIVAEEEEATEVASKAAAAVNEEEADEVATSGGVSVAAAAENTGGAPAASSEQRDASESPASADVTPAPVEDGEAHAGDVVTDVGASESAAPVTDFTAEANPAAIPAVVMADSTDPRVPVELLGARITVQTIQVSGENDEAREFDVAVYRPIVKKPFLGGFRSKETGLEYHNASSQTYRNPRNDGKVRFHQTTQTQIQRDYDTNNQQTCVTTSTQVSRAGVVVDTTHDKVLIALSGAYETSAHRAARFLHAAIMVQKYFRRWKARREVGALRRARAEFDAYLARREEERRQAVEEEHISQVHRRVNPRTAEDFDLLYSGLEVWRVEQVQAIMQLPLDQQQAAKAALLAQQCKYLSAIDQLKLTADVRQHWMLTHAG